METEFFAACREYKCLCATCGCEHHCGTVVRNVKPVPTVPAPTVNMLKSATNLPILYLQHL